MKNTMLRENQRSPYFLVIWEERKRGWLDRSLSKPVRKNTNPRNAFNRIQHNNPFPHNIFSTPLSGKI
ncbi:hypothetical protein L6452_40735 [Arctium lappa]|uniref:Uncharacterized protein n=1 Tax=Arctium lappa TaxID=4217 RepID=A0ACB8XRV8_ARCLA|nr:hypothetical protein L6452_40735 [Arctium lappa]